MLNTPFVFAIICTGIQRRKYVLTLFLVVFQIDKNKKIDRPDKLPVTTYCYLIVSYGITIRRSKSEYFTIKGCSLHLYNCVIKCHNTRAYMSAIPSMSQNLDDDMPGNVFNVHTNVSIDTKLFTCKIRTYDIKHLFRHMPQCARLSCISSMLIDFLLIDFSQHILVFT